MTALNQSFPEETARFLEREADFFSEPSNSDLLGEDLESAEYWMAALRASRDYTRDIFQRLGTEFASRRDELSPLLTVACGAAAAASVAGVCARLGSTIK